MVVSVVWSSQLITPTSHQRPQSRSTGRTSRRGISFSKRSNGRAETPVGGSAWRRYFSLPGRIAGRWSESSVIPPSSATNAASVRASFSTRSISGPRWRASRQSGSLAHRRPWKGARARLLRSAFSVAGIERSWLQIGCQLGSTSGPTRIPSTSPTHTPSGAPQPSRKVSSPMASRIASSPRHKA